MKSFKFLVPAALVLAACTPKAGITGTIEDAPGRSVEVRRLNINTWEVLDTIKTNADCAFRYNIKVAKGQPEFVYLFSGNTKLASMLVKSGDSIKIEADTLGNYTIEGSEDSKLLQQREKSFADFASKFAALDGVEGQGSAMARLFIDHYREDVSFVISHPYSLVSVPVLYESINEYTPMFNQLTDAIIFRQTADSLKTVYPESRYVQALDKEAARREQQLRLQSSLSNAEEALFPEINLPSINGDRISLTGVGSKVVLLHFWDPSAPEQKMFNQDVLKPLYDRWHSRGLEIYAVGVSSDKPRWASVVSAQKLPWINVCDGQGVLSVALRTYNVGALPWSALIGKEGGVTSIKGQQDLDNALSRLLK